nr:immunoglobulin light chain junction region [Macaca mulatta]MOV98732.1 immunoglobulin light chain junction region [Macaca mulatta]MOV98975.1 immunoglobulin light chain junction region [Macaca mulatta]MOV99910.1 immunoglobulin light chain junction region [Macaca mulatta]MOW00410.1 immunoglobulin light chain junction region [Macaca mulatta]
DYYCCSYTTINTFLF